MQRLDTLLVKRGKAVSRNKAQSLIRGGQVRICCAGEWMTAVKASQKYPDCLEIDILQGEFGRFVSRGGMKLSGAISESNIDFSDKTVIDIGQSTGGFTDCSLQCGASRVIGIDVGCGQLAKSLQDDPRVICFEGINARELPANLLDYTDSRCGFDIAVVDVSFISQTRVLPSLIPLLKSGGQLLSLVKPQFEVGISGIGKGGIVRDQKLYPQVEQKIKKTCEQLGMIIKGYFNSQIPGGDGNREFFIWAHKAD